MRHSFRPLDGIENGSIPPLCNIYYAKAGALCYNETNTVFQSFYDYQQHRSVKYLFGISSILKRFLGDNNDKEIARYRGIVEQINALEPSMVNLTDDKLTGYTQKFRERLAQGETMEEALAMAQDAIGLMLEDVAPADYPAPSLPQDLPLEKDRFVLMVPFDKLAYDRAYNSKSVKNTLPVPAWLDTLAAEHNVNFSNVLQNALMRELGVSKA